MLLIGKPDDLVQFGEDMRERKSDFRVHGRQHVRCLTPTIRSVGPSFTLARVDEPDVSDTEAQILVDLGFDSGSAVLG
jgi:hypothetical protein